MTETLVIRLLADGQAAGQTASQTVGQTVGQADDGNAPDGGQAEWAVVDATGACVLAPATGPLLQAAPLCAGRRTVVLVPAARVLRTRVDVPLKGAARIAQALPFALEDTLADDVEDLHFAAGTRYPDDQVAVAVVRREWIDAWQSRLAAAGIAGQAMYADSDGVVDITGTSTLVLEEQHAMLRDPGCDPVISDLATLEGLLELWLAQPRPPAADGVVPPRNLQVYDATVEGLPNRIWEELQERVASLEVRRLPDGALLRLGAAIVTSPGVNLLQGDYAQRTSMGSYWPRWRLAAALVATLAATVIAAAGADAWRLRQEGAALEAEIRAAADFTFPGADAGGNLGALVAARLEGNSSAAQGAASRQFLYTLQTVAVAVAKTGNATIEGINYRAGVMELQVRAPSADALDTIRKFVAEAGRLQAEIQSSNAAGDEIQGRIRISSSGA
ncbi:MAG: type II secretion system protein GspL [Gammaproteobacteria bacterium]